MTSTGARRRPQKYPVELRERAVKMVLEIREQTGERHGAVTRVAKELGIGSESLRGWVNRAEIDSGRRAGTSTADAQRIAQLERENRELRRANDILKAASVFFATELDGRRRGSCLHRRPPGSRLRWAAMGGRADLPDPGDRPHDLLVGQDATAVREGPP